MVAGKATRLILEQIAFLRQWASTPPEEEGTGAAERFINMLLDQIEDLEAEIRQLKGVA